MNQITKPASNCLEDHKAESYNAISSIHHHSRVLGHCSPLNLNETVLEPNSENCLTLIFVASPCEKIIISQMQIMSHLQSENPCWTCQVLVVFKM